MFGTNKDTDFDGFAVMSFSPGLHENCELVEIKLSAPKKDDGTELKKRIQFYFENAEGQKHLHEEYDPENDEKKAKNLIRRVGHIMSKFVPKDQLAQQNTDFISYAKWVVAKLGTSFKGKKVKIIAVGNVYNGKASVRLPGFPPFIAKQEDTLQLTNTHILDNSKYDEHMSGGQSKVEDSALSDFEASGPITEEPSAFGSAPVEDPGANFENVTQNPAQSNAGSDFQ